MTRTATIAFAVLSFATVGFIGDLHANDPLSTYNRGARDGKAESSGYRVRGCADHEMVSSSVSKQICNRYAAPEVIKAIRKGPNGG